MGATVATETEDDVCPQCTAITGKGTRCTRKAPQGEEFCGTHVKQQDAQALFNGGDEEEEDSPEGDTGLVPHSPRSVRRTNPRDLLSEDPTLPSLECMVDLDPKP